MAQYVDLDGIVRQDDWLSKDDYEDVNPSGHSVSIIDIDRLPPMDMDVGVTDNCEECGGNNMRVGDYVCWGHCYPCFQMFRRLFLEAGNERSYRLLAKIQQLES